MTSDNTNFQSRHTERLFLLLITIVMGFLFFQLFSLLKKDFADVPKRLSDGTMMNLNDVKPGEHINTLLQKGFYFSDAKDINLISTIVVGNN